MTVNSQLATASSQERRLQPSAGMSTVILSTAPLLSAILGTQVPWPVVAAIGACGMVVLSPRLLVVALVLLVGVRAGAAIESLEPVPTSPVESVSVRLVNDPRDGAFGEWALVGVDGHRLVATTSGVGGSFGTALAGDRLVVTGTLQGRTPESGWEISNRIVGSLRIAEVHEHVDADGLRGYANVFREVLAHGGRSLSREHQALLAGLTVGDDREQSAVTADNFRAAGLGHLLAVSGQNVVFVLIAAAPALSRIRSTAVRVGATLLVLCFFGFVTRFEPSVTRALTMVGLTIIAAAIGRPADAHRTLPIAVITLLLWDPLLARALAFQLSIAATLGLLVIAPRLQERLPGPDAIRGLLAATIGAQLAVAPLLVIFFDDVSLIAVPANMAAVPISGVVMMWGMTGGFVAGLSPPVIAQIIHLPTNLMLWWIESVAEVAATTPVASLGARGALLVLLGLTVTVVARTLRIRSGYLVGIGFIVLSLVIPIAVPRELAIGHHRIAEGLTVHRHPTGVDLVVIGEAVDHETALQALRLARLGRVDLVVSNDGSRSAGPVVLAITQRHEVLDVWAPPGHQIPGARTVASLSGHIGELPVRVAPDGTVEFGGGA